VASMAASKMRSRASADPVRVLGQMAAVRRRLVDSSCTVGMACVFTTRGGETVILHCDPRNRGAVSSVDAGLLAGSPFGAAVRALMKAWGGRDETVVAVADKIQPGWEACRVSCRRTRTLGLRAALLALRERVGKTPIELQYVFMVRNAQGWMVYRPKFTDGFLPPKARGANHWFVFASEIVP
jgi:hypothetical protein